MEERYACAACLRPFAPGDTVVAPDGRALHVDCTRPQTLRPEERALLFRYCSDHTVADCKKCGHSYRFCELGSDIVGGGTNLCTRCHADLTDNLRAHVTECKLLPGRIRERARQAINAGHALMKYRQELVEARKLLAIELEAALKSLREAMVNPPQSSA